MAERSRRRYLTLVFGVTMTSIMGNSLLSPVIPDILKYFSQPDSSGGLLISATSLPGIFVAPIVGLLADRWGRRELLTPSLALFGLCGLGAALAPTFLTLLLFRFGMGVGSAGLINLAIVLIGDRFASTERVRWVGINSGVLTVGLALFPLLAGVLESIGGWRLAIAPYGLALPIAGFTWRTLGRSSRAQPSPFVAQLQAARTVLRQPLLIANFFAAAVAFAVIFGVFLGSVPTLLGNAFGLPALWRGVVLGVPALFSSITAFNLGPLERRFGRGPLLLGCGIAWLIAFSIMGLSPWLSLFLFGTAVYGLGEGGMIPALQNAALDRAPDEHRAVVLAVWTASARLGQTVGPLIAGALIATADGRGATLAGAVGSVALLGVFVLAIKLGRREPIATAS